VQPFTELLAEEFEKTHAGFAVNVQGGGSTAGVTSARSGIAAIGMLSRYLKDGEKDLIAYEIAKDGLAIIINPKNPIIRKSNNADYTVDLTEQIIQDIYSGKIKEWNDPALNGNKGKIHVIMREEGSGTRTAFEDLIMTEALPDGSKNIVPTIRKAIVQNSNGAVRLLVSKDPNAIGYISLGLIDIKGQKPVKAVSLNGVEAKAANVGKTYMLYRPFLFVVSHEPEEGLAKDFIEFVLGPRGKEILSDPKQGLIVD
jgi:phosphate transport system substrate-binding protein